MSATAMSIDFGNGNIKTLFGKMLLPTLLGMILTALFTITDGIFVGRGLGSDALAAVNIVAPLYLISTGIGLMFGMGGSVIASIHISKGEIEAARLKMTQSLVISTIFLLLCTCVIFMFPEFILRLSGCSDILMPLAKDYLMGFITFFSINALIVSCGFFVRLSGAPNYSMWCVAIAAIVNLTLDYLFIFIFKMGMFGAAFATGIGTSAGVAMMIFFLSRRSNLLNFKTDHFSHNLLANIRDIIKVGFASLICEAAIASMIICGNFVFMSQMGEKGVAAFGIACYLSPIIFMVYNAIAQSAQPIISYNYGESKNKRANSAFKLALNSAVIFGSLLLLITYFGSGYIVGLFISESDPAYHTASTGLPLFALGFIPFAINIISIGYFQSLERISEAMIITILRGFVLMIICFIAMPAAFGEKGAWLAVPASEFITSLYVAVIYFYNRIKDGKSKL